MDGIIPERLGNLHLVFLHLPIGFVVAAVLLEFWRWKRPSAEGAWLQGRLLAANAIATLLAAGAGLLLAATGTYSEQALALHRWAGVLCAGLSIAAWLAHQHGGAWPGRATLALLFVATTAAGHLGATLTHGERVTAWWGDPPAPTPAPEEPKATHDDATAFADAIAPILNRSCIECHGPEKARGKLRLDTRAAALAGGKSGLPALVPGEPARSEIIRRIKLPADDEDAMPLEDEPRLTAAEIAALESWIAAGALWR